MLIRDIHGTSIYETIKFTILDRLLNLSSIDWTDRYLSLTNDTLRSVPLPTPRPSHAHPADPAGTYDNPAYGAIELCYVSPTPHIESATCATLRSAADTILPGAINSTVPTLLAHVNRLFTSHLRLEHFSGGVWNVTELTSLVRSRLRLECSTRPLVRHQPRRLIVWTAHLSLQAPVGKERDYYASSSLSGSAGVVAEWAEGGKGGFGLRGGIWGAGSGVEDPQIGRAHV